MCLVADPTKPAQQRLNAEHDVDPDSANTLGGPTAVVHRHSRVLAFSIYRNYYSLKRTRKSTATTSTTSPRSSEIRTRTAPMHDCILLATKRIQERQFTLTKSTQNLGKLGSLPEEGDNCSDTRRELLPAITAPSPIALSPHDSAKEDSDHEFMKPVSRPSSKRTIDLLRRLSQSVTQRFDDPPSGSTSHIISSNITPPWMTLAPRSKQEEAHMIPTLNSTFKDVGFAPSTRSKRGAPFGRRPKNKDALTQVPDDSPNLTFKDVGLIPSTLSKHGVPFGRRPKNKDALTQVPDDSMCMLLPLWPHETDPTSATRTGRQRKAIVADQGQKLYLLVYYVPFDQRGKGNPTTKRSRSSPPRKGEQYPTPQFDVRHGLKIMGRLFAHSDLQGSRIRLPIRGLSVTGSLAEAELAIPPVHSDDFLMGSCLDPDGTTIDLFPDGLEKLGLCVPRTEPPVQQTADPEDVTFQPLNAIGRAAVEIAWLGCMALMTFYGPQPESEVST